MYAISLSNIELVKVKSILSVNAPDKVREACSKLSSKVSGVYLETFLAPSATSDSHDPLLKYSCFKNDISRFKPLSNSLENLTRCPFLSLEL